jgi:DNA primase
VVLEGSGLALRTRNGNLVDRFRDRMTLGIRDIHGDVVGFTCRAAPSADVSCPKYLNSPTTALYRKSEVLFGLGEASARHETDRVPVLVEGPLDAMAVDSSGLDRYAPLAACGTAFSTVHADLLAELSTTGEVVVALDDDGAGRRAAAHVLEVLRSRGIEPLAVDRVADDPAELLQVRGPTALAMVLSGSRRLLVEQVVEDVIRDAGDRLRWVEGRVLTARAVMPMVAQCSVVQAARIASKVARLCDLATETVADELRAELERSTISAPRAGPEHRQPAVALNQHAR